MSDTNLSAPTPKHAQPQSSTESGVRLPGLQRSGWVGPIIYAGVMMIVLGFFHAFQGLIALADEDYYLVGTRDLTIHLDYTVWGWAHLILGAVVLVAGVGLLNGTTWGRVAGVILAVLSVLVNVAFLAAYPIWSTIMIAVDLLVIWALTVHGGEMRTMDDA